MALTVKNIRFHQLGHLKKNLRCQKNVSVCSKTDKICFGGILDNFCYSVQSVVDLASGGAFLVVIFPMKSKGHFFFGGGGGGTLVWGHFWCPPDINTMMPWVTPSLSKKISPMGNGVKSICERSLGNWVGGMNKKKRHKIFLCRVINDAQNGEKI